MAKPTFDVFTDELDGWLETLEEVTLDALDDDVLPDLLDEFEALSVELAPVETGNLEASTVTQFFRQGNSMIGLLSFVAPYAAAVHELPETARGPRTERKPGNEFGQAGPKYVERPLRGMQKRFPDTIGEKLLKVWRRNARIG